MGTHAPANGEPRKLGSRIEASYAKQGANFLSPAIAKLAFRESVYREIGAVIEQERLWTNMLSSQPLCFNLFGDLKLNPDKGNKFFQQLFPDYGLRCRGGGNLLRAFTGARGCIPHCRQHGL